MKKIFAMAAIALFMVSCSDDDSNSTNQENAVLVKKMIDTDEDGTYTNILTYDGNKIISMVGTDGSTTEYTYTNGLLSKEETTYDSAIYEKTTYEYNSNNKLVSSTFYEYADDANAYAVKSVYTYNSDNTITATTYKGDENSQTELSGTRTITMTNGNIIKYSVLYDGTTVPVVTTRTYDTKNNPFKNVFAYDVMVLAALEGGNNNVLTENVDSLGTPSTTYEYLYNSDNYPTKATIDEGGYIYTTEYFY